MIRLSAGTAASLGLTTSRMDTFPTTAYLLSGNKCLMKCAFCPQGVGESKVLNRLGRISWPEYSWTELERGLAGAEGKGIRRICFQSVRHADGIDTLVGAIGRIKAISDLPLSLSAWIQDRDEAAALIRAGVERISVSIDVVNPVYHKKLKGGTLQNRLDLLLDCASDLPGRLNTHIICGLGETEAEALTLIDRLVRAGITVALFAFIPLKGTPMEGFEPPPVDAYRRIQTGYYLLQKKMADLSSFIFEDGRLFSYGLTEKELTGFLTDGTAFRTSGCPGCNRPYYNEKPGGVIYNYHRPLSDSECKKVLGDLSKPLKN